MLNWRAKVTLLSQIVLFILFFSWLLFLAFSPVALSADSPGYGADADHFFQGGYISQRPFLFPLFLHLTRSVGIKLSISAFLFNAGSLCFFLWYAGGCRRLFSGRQRFLLVLFFLLPAIWSFSGAQLTESILPGVEVWIVTGLAEIFFPRRPSSAGMILVYATGVSLLAVLLKPWLIYYTLLCSSLLLVAGFLFRQFRFARVPAVLLLVAGLITYGMSLKYSMSKSAWPANMVLLLCSSDKAADLRARLQQEADQNSPRAVLFRDAADDIDLVNKEYHGDPFEAPQARLKVLRFMDQDYYQRIKDIFHLAYFTRASDIAGLARLSVSRYCLTLLLGWNCLENNGPMYGPGLPWFNMLSRVCVALLVVAGIFWIIRRRKHVLRAGDLPLVIFSVCLFLSAVGLGLFLCLAGGTELTRNVLQAILFQLFVIGYFFMAFGSDGKAVGRVY